MNRISVFSLIFSLIVLTSLLVGSTFQETVWPTTGKVTILQFGTALDRGGDTYSTSLAINLSATYGYVATRSGSIIGVSGIFDWVSTSVAGDLIIEVRVNDVAVFTAQTAVATPFTGNTSITGTQQPNIDTFVAGDLITCFFDFSGGLAGTITAHDIQIEIQY